MTNKFADLEISLHRTDVKNWQVDFRYSQPDSDADIRLGQGEQTRSDFDLDRLSSLLQDPDAYSAELTQMLFQSESLRTAFAQARTSAQSQNVPLRIRLFVGASAPELHNVCWELLRDPHDGTPLATDANLLFSRYLASLDWRPVRLKPRGDLKALVVVANPSNLATLKLSEVDAGREIARAKEGLQNITTITLPDEKQTASLANILATMRSTQVDILYLVCHGFLANGQPVLVLENEKGKLDKVSGTELLVQFKELELRPRLVVLVSCQSGGKPGENAYTALGPRLAEIGVPAVLAMQDDLSMETAEKFIPVFFNELLRDGQIDRAVSVARGEVRHRFDAWVPVLVTRLKSGKLWYTPGFGEGSKTFDKFPAILQSIRYKRCTPILGAGLTEPLFGSLREIARRWAEQFHYPLMPHERESLPQVAQYLTVNLSPQFPFYELEEVLKNSIQKKRADNQPAVEDTLEAHIRALGIEQRRANLCESHKLLAELPLPVYITTNPDTLLEDALLETGKMPVSMLCPWNEHIERTQTDFDPDYLPTPENPLVFHLFGRWDRLDSLVLTEDNYFDFLIGVTGKRKLIPEVVRLKLIDSALLFLGFQTEEWNFRVLFRSIWAQDVSGPPRGRNAHIAAQFEPEEDRILEPARARLYLEQYFGGADINIYWGSPSEFLEELIERWREVQK